MLGAIPNISWCLCCPSIGTGTGTGSGSGSGSFDTGTGFTGTGTGPPDVCCEGPLPLCVRFTVIGATPFMGMPWGGTAHGYNFQTAIYGAGCVYDPNGNGNGIPAACQAMGFPTQTIFPAIGPYCINIIEAICQNIGGFGPLGWFLRVQCGGYSAISSDCLSLTGCSQPGPDPQQSNLISLVVTPGKWPCRRGSMHMPFYFEYQDPWNPPNPPGTPLTYPFWIVMNG